MDGYKVLDIKQKAEWNYYIEILPLSMKDVYFTPEYYKLYEENGDGKALCFVFKKGENLALYPFLRNSVNELGYDLNAQYYDIQGAYGYNGVISNSYDPIFISHFYESFIEFCKYNNIIAEFTRFHPLLKNHLFSRNNMTIHFDRKTMLIDLRKNNYKEIFSTFQTTTKKQINRAKNRYEIKVVLEKANTQNLSEFYSIYCETMKRVHSISYLFFNLQYFESLLLTVDSIILTAFYEGKAIASIIALFGNNNIHGHLGGARTDYLHLSAYSLLYDEMIRYGLDKKLDFFHAGGGSTNLPNDPLLQFKRNFSNETADFFVGKKIHNSLIYEEVIKQWSSKFPQKVDNFKNYLLKYRH